MRKRFFSLLLFVLMLAACSGESFHLRGSMPLPERVQQGVYIQGLDRRSDFAVVLRDALEDAGAKIVDEPVQAQTILTVVKVDEDRRVSGYSSTRQVREFQHWIDVEFRVGGPGLAMPESRVVHAERSQVYDSNYILGTATEEDSIKDELRREAVRLMLLRLQYLHG